MPADVSSCSKLRVQRLGLRDHLVGACKQRGRDGDAQRLGCLQVDHEIEFVGLLDWQLDRLGTLENAVAAKGKSVARTAVSGRSNVRLRRRHSITLVGTGEQGQRHFKAGRTE